MNSRENPPTHRIFFKITRILPLSAFARYLPTSGHARLRLLRLAMAVGSSLVSKAGSIVLQLVAIPVAIIILGPEQFGIYAALTTAWACISLSGIGVGPGLTKAISRAQAAQDQETEQIYFTTALQVLSIAGLIGASIVCGILFGIPSAILYGKGFAPYQGVIHASTPILAAIIFLETVVSAVERTQAAHQEMHKSYLWGGAGNLAGGLVLLAGISYFRSIPFLIFAVLGVPALARLGNGFSLVLRQRPYLLARGLRFDKAKAKELLGDGMAFTAAQAIAPLVMREGCKLIASHFGGPLAAGTLAVLNQLCTFLSNIVIMFSQPLWPSLMDAAARHDFAWFNSARKRLWFGAMSYATVAGLFLMWQGPWLIELWLKHEIHIYRDVFIAFACFFVVSIWAHVNYVCLIALNLLGATAAISMLEAAFVMLFTWLGMRWMGMPGLLWGMAAGLALFSAWIYPALLLQKLRRFGVQEPLTTDAPLTAEPSTPVL